MKTLRLTLLLVAGLFISISGQSQEVFFAESFSNQKKTGIDKDIEIGKNILSTLLKQELGVSNYVNIKGNYLKGYGVIFSIPQRYLGATVLNLSGKVTRLPKRDFIIVNRDEGSMSVDNDRQTKIVIDTDSIKSAQKQMVIDVSKSFLADYGNLINGLGKTEKIMITDWTLETDAWRLLSTSSEHKKQLSIEVDAENLRKHKLGEINRDELMKLIKVTNELSDASAYKDLELFSSIFHRLYQFDISDTYYVNGKLYYQYLEDFGVVYKMNVYSSVGGTSGRSDSYSMPTLALSQLSKKDRDERVKELYPIFKDQLIDHIVQYGGTLTTLKQDDLVVFKIRLTECKACDIPKSLEVSVKYEILEKTRNGALDESEAIAKFNIVEKGKQ